MPYEQLPQEQRFFAELVSGIVLNPSQFRHCWFARTPPEGPINRYSIGFPRLEMILRGEYDNLLGPTQTTLVPGDLLYIPAWSASRPGWKKDVLLLGIVFTPSYLSLAFYDKRVSEPGFRHQRTSEIPYCRREELTHLLLALNSLASRPDEQDIIRPLCLSLLHICRQILISPVTEKMIRGEFLYQSICHWIEDNYAREICRESVAVMFNISANHVSRLFSQQGSVSFVDYLRRVRMGKAKIILQKHNFSVSEVALRCGFRDADYFSRLFKRETGVTPGEYKNRFF